MIMYFILKILSFLYLGAGVQCVHQVSWLPCQFTDEHVFKNEEGHTETQLIHREALLQFGQIGDAAVNPHGITFLITVSKLDLRRYLEGVEAEQLECELRRYSTAGIHVRWPALGAREYNHWFTFTLKHINGLFRITGFLRHPSDTAAPGQQDYNSWTPIGDREMLVTTTAMVMKTLTPSVRASLGSKQKLHCQFAVDHHGPNFDVEWLLQQRGERTSLFSHSSRLAQSKGSGVLHRSLADGDASYTLPFTKLSSEGTYICSVSVLLLFVSMDIVLQIEEAPKVSLNVGPTLTLVEGGEQRVTCEADSYYPLDVEIGWYMQDPAVAGQRVGAPLPEKLQNVLLSSHKHNNDKTYSLTAFFYLQAALKHSGREFTCRVSHKSLRVPIKKSFTLTVEEPTGWMLYIVISLLLTLCVLLCYLHLARRRSRQPELSLSTQTTSRRPHAATRKRHK